MSASRTKLAARLQSALGDLRQINEDLRTRHAGAQASRKRVLNALEPRAVLRETLNNLIDSIAARYRNEHALLVAQALSTHRGKAALPSFASTPLTIHTLAGFAPDLVKASLARMIDEAKYEEGLPADARADALALIDAEIAALQQEQSDLVDEAAALGVTVALFPETVEARRRAAEQDAQEEAQRLAQERSEQFHNSLLLGTQEVLRPVDAATIRH
jgi:hypothetical protein